MRLQLVDKHWATRTKFVCLSRRCSIYLFDKVPRHFLAGKGHKAKGLWLVVLLLVHWSDHFNHLNNINKGSIIIAQKIILSSPSKYLQSKRTKLL